MICLSTRPDPGLEEAGVGERPSKRRIQSMHAFAARWLDMCPPCRVWMSVNRLPMGHCVGGTGPRAASNTPFAWAVWQRGAPREHWQRYYWKALLASLNKKEQNRE